MVLSQDGIFSRAEKATDKYGQAKARETLELALGEAQMQKYEQGLTDEQLDNKINEIGELLPKEDENSNNQQVIVDGSIFEIDRSVPKIVDYIGPADGVIITAKVIGNDGWLKEGEKVTVIGTIKTYSGGTITNANATIGSNPITEFPKNGGNYIIENITEDTNIIITATDSNGKTNTKTIKIVIKKDITPPTIKSLNVTAEWIKIKISATAEDLESGLKNLTYSITPTIGLNKPTGTFFSGETIEVTSTADEVYTITITAEDKLGNTTKQTSEPVTILDMITVEEAKAKVNEKTLPDYIGTKVDYKPIKGGIWRVFYYDKIGEFGNENTLYLKRDYDEVITLSSYISSEMTENGLLMMKQFNPLWKKYGNNANKSNFNRNEKATAALCNTNNWTQYATGHPNLTTKFAIGGAPVEMWVKSYNIFIERYEPTEKKIDNHKLNSNGYGWETSDGGITGSKSIKIDYKIEKSKVLATSDLQWLASPVSSYDDFLCAVRLSGLYIEAISRNAGVTPVVAL